MSKLTVNQKRQSVINQYKRILGRNIYSQDLNKRECAFNKYQDGKYYSDCSSSIRLAYKEADIGLNNIGGNTVSQYQSKIGKRVDVTIKNGLITDCTKLRIGDCIYFAGTDSNRGYADFCGHVEMVYSIIGNSITISGHGSGNPSLKSLNNYCLTRFNSKTKTKLGNKGVIGIMRFIQDGDSKPVNNPPKNDKNNLKEWVKKVQRVLGVNITGIADTITLRKTISISQNKNRTHPVVALLQERLNYLGYNCGDIDGVAGEKFDIATKRFQKEKVQLKNPDGEFTSNRTSWVVILGN